MTVASYGVNVGHHARAPSSPTADCDIASLTLVLPNVGKRSLKFLSAQGFELVPAVSSTLNTQLSLNWGGLAAASSMCELAPGPPGTTRFTTSSTTEEQKKHRDRQSRILNIREPISVWLSEAFSLSLSLLLHSLEPVETVVSNWLVLYCVVSAAMIQCRWLTGWERFFRGV